MFALALQRVKTKYYSASTFTTRGYVWPMKSLDPDNLAPKQILIAEGLDDFAFACV